MQVGTRRYVRAACGDGWVHVPRRTGGERFAPTEGGTAHARQRTRDSSECEDCSRRGLRGPRSERARGVPRLDATGPERQTGRISGWLRHSTDNQKVSLIRRGETQAPLLSSGKVKAPWAGTSNKGSMGWGVRPGSYRGRVQAFQESRRQLSCGDGTSRAALSGWACRSRLSSSTTM